MLAVTALLLITPRAGLAAPPDWPRLMGGEIVVEAIRNSQGIRGVRTRFVVSASRQAIWKTLVDYENFPLFFRGIERMTVLTEDASGARIEFWADVVLRDLHYVLRRNYERPGYRLTWERESGDLERIEGSWSIVATGVAGKHLLIYESYVDIGFSAITYFIQHGAMTRAGEMADTLRNWIEPAGQDSVTGS